MEKVDKSKKDFLELKSKYKGALNYLVFLDSTNSIEEIQKTRAKMTILESQLKELDPNWEPFSAN